MQLRSSTSSAAFSDEERREESWPLVYVSNTLHPCSPDHLFWRFLVYTCQKAQPKRCDFFLWDDEAKGREAAAVLNNSRTEPFTELQTPQKPSPYGLATPQTSTRFGPASPEITAQYTPSRNSNAAPVVSSARSSKQASTTQGSDSDDEFYEWPASDDDELSKAADQASSGHTMAPPETPRKAVKIDLYSTPGKRKYDEIASDDAREASWATPSTGLRANDIFTIPANGASGKGLFANTTTLSPAETPTPIRYKDMPPTQDSELATEVFNALQLHSVSLPPEVRASVKHICNRHVLHTKGILKGRDVSRAMVKTKEERIAELQGEIDGLKAERETNRAVIRHLRRDMVARKEAGM